MVDVVELETERLRLRQWRDSDYPAFADMNSDPEVMAYYPAVLSQAESNAMADNLRGLIAARGWGFWAIEEKQSGAFAGFVGLHEPSYDLPVTPCVEIGWRLGKANWRRGYATEAARASLRFAFEHLQLDEIYSFCSVQNQRSWSVMERIDMVNTGRNFEHPIIPEGHALRKHVLFKITKEQWNAIAPTGCFPRRSNVKLP